MHSTMEDIARECGVSKMTVSRVLSGRQVVSAKTREKVLEVAKKLNYEFNTLAANFALKRSGFVGVATPFVGLLGTEYFAAVFRGFQKVLHKAGWDCALFDTLSDAFNDGVKLARLYRQKKVDGLLIVAPHMHDRFLESLANLGVPVVAVGEQIASRQVSSVSCDDDQGMTEVCEHLYELGHRDIAFVGGPQDLATARDRQAAYKAFCRQMGLDTPLNFLQPGEYTIQSGKTAARILLESERRPTAIIGVNDFTAFGVIECAREMGLRVPEDLSVTGFDDMPSAAERHPALTTVHQPAVEMGEAGAEILVRMMTTGQLSSAKISLKVSLVARQSTARPPASKP
ncbi:MAG: LacI family DNA-binding transcriptional regulator [Chthoniobacterales bacterium]